MSAIVMSAITAASGAKDTTVTKVATDPKDATSAKTTREFQKQVYQSIYQAPDHVFLQAAKTFGLEHFLRDAVALNLSEIVMQNGEYGSDLVDDGTLFAPVLSVPPSPSAATDTDKDSLDRDLDCDSEGSYPISSHNPFADKNNPYYEPSDPAEFEHADGTIKFMMEEPIVEKATNAPKTLEVDRPQQTPTKKLVKSKTISWADISEEDEKNRAAEDTVFKKKLDGLSWALRVKLSDVPVEKLDDVIAAESQRLKQIEEKNRADDAAAAKAIADQESKAAKEAAAAAAKFARFHSFPPKKPAAKISNGDVKAKLEKQERDLEDAKNGFVKVVGKMRRPPVQQEVSNNKYREKEKTTTSAKWFCFPENPIMSESDDWNLWDYEFDKYGRVKPIGWVQVSHNKFKINRKSQFVHTRHEDGSWTVEEEVYDANGNVKMVSVSLAYLRWILTPMPMRRGACPDE